MLGRRRDERFTFTIPARGVMRVYSDVIVQDGDGGEWIAIGRDSAVAGEILMLDIDLGHMRRQCAVHVIESRPVIADGQLRYRIRLQDADARPVLFEQEVRRG